MKKKDNFERNWMIIFGISYVLIMLPFPFYYSETYIPSFFGVPLFIYGWLVHGCVVLGLIVVFAKQCMKRPEYKNFDNSDSSKVKGKS